MTYFYTLFKKKKKIKNQDVNYQLFLNIVSSIAVIVLNGCEMKFSILLDRHGEQICFVGQKFSELSNALCRYWRRVGKDLEWFNLGISLITFRFRMRGTRTSD